MLASLCSKVMEARRPVYVLAKQFLPMKLAQHLAQECSKEEAAHEAFAAIWPQKLDGQLPQPRTSGGSQYLHPALLLGQ